MMLATSDTDTIHHLENGYFSLDDELGFTLEEGEVARVLEVDRATLREAACDLLIPEQFVEVIAENGLETHVGREGIGMLAARFPSEGASFFANVCGR